MSAAPQTRRRPAVPLLCFGLSLLLLLLLYRAGGFRVYTTSPGSFQYGIGSPVDLLCLLLPRSLWDGALQALLILRAALAATALCWYLGRHFCAQTPLLAVLSTAYAAGVYTACVVNVVWTDAALILPLLLDATDQALSGRWKALAALTFVCVLANCYTAWPLCLCCLLYLVWQWGAQPGKLDKAALPAMLRRFLPPALGGGGAALALVLPVIFHHFSSGAVRLETGAVHSVTFSLNRISYCLFYTRYSLSLANAGLPYLYSGMAAVALALLYFFGRAGTRQKLFSAFFLVLLAASYLLEMPGIAWQNGEDVTVFPYRYGFIFSAMLLLFAADTLLHGGVPAGGIAASLAAAFIWALCCRGDAGAVLTHGRFAMGLLLYGVACLCFWLREHRPAWRAAGGVILSVLLLTDLYASSCITLYGTLRIL